MPQWMNGFRFVVYDALSSLGIYSVSTFVHSTRRNQKLSSVISVSNESCHGLISSFFMVVVAKDRYIQTVSDFTV